MRRILFASLLARFPATLVPLAAILLVRQETGSFALAGAVAGTVSLARAGAAPTKGFLLDTFGQGRVLPPTAVVNGASLVGLDVAADIRSTMGMFGAALLAGAAAPPTAACARVLWPHLTRGAQLTERAYNLDAVCEESTLVLGPLVVAGVVEFSSPGVAILTSAGITILGNFTFSLVATAVGPPSVRNAASRIRPVRLRSLRSILLTMWIVGCTWGAITIGLVATAQRLGMNGDAGLLLALVAAGSVLGGLLHGTMAQRLPVSTRHSLLLALVGFLCLPLVVARSLPLAAFSSVIAGLPFAPVLACQYTLVGAHAPPGAEAEAFTWSGALLGGGVAAGSAIAGLALHAGTAPVFGACAVAGLVAAALARRVNLEAGAGGASAIVAGSSVPSD